MNQDKNSIKGFSLADLTIRGGQYVANWRVLAPEIDNEKCIACGLCGTYCPEGAIQTKPREKPKIDMRFCKGCGVCANECPQKAIDMKRARAWLCYDNEAYMNTGIQRSGSTPLFSATSTTPVGKIWSGKQMRWKNLEMIMAAHRIPYIATGSLSYLPDLERKIRKAAEITRAGKGLAFLHIQQPCATGWYFPESKTVEVGKLAVQTGAWPLMEIEEGNFKLNFKPKELRPIAEYLKPQQRFRHLKDEQIELLQKDATAEWNALLEMEKRGKFPGY